MTQPGIDVSTDSTTLLREVLRLIAHNPDLNRVVPLLLRASCQIMNAPAAFYTIFASPDVLITENVDPEYIPSAEILATLSEQLDDEIHAGSNLPEPLATHYSGWLIVPIRSKGQVVCLVGLLFEEAFSFETESSDLLMSLIDGLIIVTNEARRTARHDTLMKNQYEFVRIVSHDLRSPLTSTQGFASMLESSTVGDLNERQLYFVGKILSGIEQMTSLVDNIQDAGRYDPETGFYEMERIPTDLTELLAKIVQNHLLPAEKQELTVKMQTSDDIPIVNVDSTMLERAIINLVDNAIKYTPNGGEIQVGVKQEQDELVIFVQDNGYGISPENLKKLFQRHFRIRRREHKRVKGSGLGLFIVRSVAQQHGGRAMVESVEDEGTTFAITIPLKGANLIGGGAATADV